jgi:hypothetical protein
MLNAQIADVVAPGGKRGREHGVVLKRGTLTNRKGLHLVCAALWRAFAARHSKKKKQKYS